MPQAKLLKFLEGVGSDKGSMDCSIVPTKIPGVFMISTTDFFYPLVDDPFIQGMIGCANVLSDLYSMGIPDCDTMLMLLASSREMPERERDIVTKLMMHGFVAKAREAETEVTGGQTVMNPWPIIGGVATSVCRQGTFLSPFDAEAGDVLVLTKPLGTQVAVNSNQWFNLRNSHYEQVKEIVSEEEVRTAFEKAVKSMCRLNRFGAQLIMDHHAHAATDVTGFGILGHSRNLAKNQRASVNLEIHTLPIISPMARIDQFKQAFKLLEGLSAETSGGLLVALPSQQAAEDFCRNIEAHDNAPAWIIGRVLGHDGPTSKNTAFIVENPTIIDV